MVILTGADVGVYVEEESSFGGSSVDDSNWEAISYSTRIGSLRAIQNKVQLYNLGKRSVEGIVDLQFEGEIELSGLLSSKKVLYFIDNNPSVATDSPATGYQTTTFLASAGNCGSFGVLVNNYSGSGNYALFKGYVVDEFSLACRVNEVPEFRVRGFYKNFETGSASATTTEVTYSDMWTFTDIGITIGGDNVDVVSGFDLSLRLNREGIRKLGSRYIEGKVSKNIEVSFSMEIPAGGGGNYAFKKIETGWTGDIEVKIGDYTAGETQYIFKLLDAELRDVGESISATDIINERYSFIGKDLQIEFIEEKPEVM